MAVTFDGAMGNVSGSAAGTTQTLTTTAGAAAGELVVVTAHNAIGETATGTGATDPRGNAYSLAIDNDLGADGSVSIWYTIVAAGKDIISGDVITFTWDVSFTTGKAVTAQKFGGIQLTTPLDRTKTNQTASATRNIDTAATATTTVANEAVVGAGTFSNGAHAFVTTMTADLTGWTTIVTATGLIVVYQIPVATGTFRLGTTGTNGLAIAADWSVSIATFKAAAAGGVVPPKPTRTLTGVGV